MTATFVPEGIPQGLTVGQCARALQLREETIKSALNSNALPSWQIDPGRGWRYVRPEDLAQFAALRGLRVKWEVLL